MLRRKNNLDKITKRIIKRLWIKIRRYKTKLIIICIIMFFLVWINISYKKYIDNKKNIINTVYFDKYIINNSQLTWLIYFTEKTFSWANSVKNKIFWYKKEKEKILNKYNMLKNVKIHLIDNKSIKVWLDFKKPKLNFIWGWKIYAVYDKNLIKGFDIKSISWLNLTWVNKLYLPNYLSWIKIDNKIFFKIKLETIIEYSNKIKNLFPNAKLYYIAWWKAIKVQTKDKIYFFSLKKSIKKQLDQLYIVKHQIPWKFKNSKVIDLWNLEDWVYLKKNYLWK